MGIIRLLIFTFATSLAANALVAAEPIDEATLEQELRRTSVDPDGTASVTIKAPIEFVFEFLSQRPQDYTTDAVSVEFNHGQSAFPGRLDSGSHRIITLNTGDTLVQRFLEFETPVAYAYLTDMSKSTASLPLDYIVTRYQLAETDVDSTLLQVSLVYEPSSRLLAFFVRRAVRAALQSDFERAAAIIESHWARNRVTE